MKHRRFIWIILASVLVVLLFVFVTRNKYQTHQLTDRALDTKYRTRQMTDGPLDTKHRMHQMTDTKHKTHQMTDQHLDSNYKTHQMILDQHLDSNYKTHQMIDQHLDTQDKKQKRTNSQVGNNHKSMTGHHLNKKFEPQLDNTRRTDQLLASVVKTLQPNQSTGKIITRDTVGWTIVGNGTCKRQHKFILSRLLPLNIPIFVYPPETDIHISRMIINSGSWEGNLIDKMVIVMKRHPDAVFIDIGANIGVYSLTMATLGYRVIAIDCFIENVKRICASSIYSNTTDKISIIHNGLSNKRVKLRLIKSTQPNVGGMGVEQITSQPWKMKNTSSVQAILLDDLLEIFPMRKAILKMDVEKHEEKVLKGATNFFNTVRVECVLLEFRFHTNKKSGQFIIDFLNKYGLKPILPSSVSKSDYKTWPGDIIWKRDDKTVIQI